MLYLTFSAIALKNISELFLPKPQLCCGERKNIFCIICMQHLSYFESESHFWKQGAGRQNQN